MYENFFGFEESPFRVTPDPRFLYHNASYDEAIAALSYGINHRKGFVALIGEVGTGKTTLLRNLLDTIGPNVRTVLLIYPTVSFLEILEQILNELGIPVEGAGKGAMLQRLHEFLLDHTASGGNVALLFDEAQALSSETLEELRLLSNLETGSEKIVQIVLAGQPEFETKLRLLQHRQLRQRIALHIRLAPLSAEEVPAYVRTRLEHAGAPDLDLFEPEALARITEVTGGIPRIVNVLCDACCTTALASEQPRISRAIVDEAWADYAVLDNDAPMPVDAAVPKPAAVTVAPAPVTEKAPAASAPVEPPAPEPPAPSPTPTPAPPTPTPAPPTPTPAPPTPTPAPPTPTPAPPTPTPAPPTPTPAPPTPTPAPPTPTPAPPTPRVPRTDAPLEPDADEPSRPSLQLLAVGAVGAALIGGIAAYRMAARTPAPESTLPMPPSTVHLAQAPPTTPPAVESSAESTDPVAAAVPTEPPTALAALDVVDAFRQAYESEDLPELTALFTTTARKGEIMGRDDIAADYERFFASTEGIVYAQPSASVEPRVDHVLVRAPFEITYRDLTGRPVEVRGRATWRIVRLGADPRIATLDFEVDPVAVP